jgi:hypothetical protein
MTLILTVFDNSNAKRSRKKALHCILIALTRPFFYVYFHNNNENVFFSFYQYNFDGSLKGNHSPFICTYICSAHRHKEAFFIPTTYTLKDIISMRRHHSTIKFRWEEEEKEREKQTEWCINKNGLLYTHMMNKP